MGYSTDYETLGLKGSFSSIGPGFTSAAASPLAFYKFYTGEGGLRVPLIVSGQPLGDIPKQTDAFAWATDIAATILALANVAFARGALWRPSRAANDRARPNALGKGNG